MKRPIRVLMLHHTFPPLGGPSGLFARSLKAPAVFDHVSGKLSDADSAAKTYWTMYRKVLSIALFSAVG